MGYILIYLHAPKDRLRGQMIGVALFDILEESV
jgi:hypothetical protein